MVSEKNTDKSGSVPEFSVVIPIYNEEETIPELCRRLQKTHCCHGKSRDL
jgi:hypothetical protein